MPPQPGVFALPYASTHKSQSRHGHGHDADMGYHGAGTTHDGMKVSGKEKKKKDIAGKLGKEMNDRRDDGRHYTETISALHSTSIQLCTRPSTSPLYNLRLYPLSLERSALLAQYAAEERYSLDSVQAGYEEERVRVEDEWRRGRERLRERLVEGIEERRRRAREEKEGEGIIGDASLDSQSRPHVTRKLRNKLGNTSPPPTPTSVSLANGNSDIHGAGSTTPLAAAAGGPVFNPLSLAIEELPSPFPLPLTSVSLLPKSASSAVPTSTDLAFGLSGAIGKGRRKPKGLGGSGIYSQAGFGGLGKSLEMLAGCREGEVESDLGEIRRGNKRRRVAAVSMGKS